MNIDGIGVKATLLIDGIDNIVENMEIAIEIYNSFNMS